MLANDNSGKVNLSEERHFFGIFDILVYFVTVLKVKMEQYALFHST